MAPLLAVKDLTTRFSTTDGEVHAVNGVSFDVEDGQILGIVGESGCGKTVTALSMMRLIPDPPGRIVRGEVWFGGRDLLRLSEEGIRQVRGNQIAMIFQSPMTSLNPVLTVGRQLGEAMELHMGMTAKQARAHSIELLRMVHIPEASACIDDYPHQFSGGMLQRVMIAMALSCHPQLLIADEPTTALDVTIQAQIIDLIKQLKRELGMAILWITHDLGIMAGLAERVQVMYAGFIVERADVRAFYAHPRHPYSQGLFAALPQQNGKERGKLTSIQGVPPDLFVSPQGCSFSARCGYSIPRCLEENPQLQEVAPGHEVACWGDIIDGGIG
ncbi:MAG: peptide ABC transporter ATP-binding protein [Chloroflexi bacterium RBG_13_56_8]|nr:MAG: peptide ABC transporter ATP-binding protein [Chloroflexi bacterium RBG_13_56_8]